MTSLSPSTRLSVVTVSIFNTTPAPLLSNLCALSGWSPFSGTMSMGTAWHSPSNRPCEPAWVMNARAPGCAKMKHRFKKKKKVVFLSHRIDFHVIWYKPRRSFWGTHFIILTFSGTFSGIGPVYLHITCQKDVNFIHILFFFIITFSCLCLYFLRNLFKSLKENISCFIWHLWYYGPQSKHHKTILLWHPWFEILQKQAWYNHNFC